MPIYTCICPSTLYMITYIMSGIEVIYMVVVLVQQDRYFNKATTARQLQHANRICATICPTSRPTLLQDTSCNTEKPAGAAQLWGLALLHTHTHTHTRSPHCFTLQPRKLMPERLLTHRHLLHAMILEKLLLYLRSSKARASNDCFAHDAGTPTTFLSRMFATPATVAAFRQKVVPLPAASEQVNPKS